MKRADNPTVPTSAEPMSEPLVFGRAKEIVLDVAARIRAACPDMDREALIKLAGAFRSALIPKRRPGRRPKPAITAAHQDWCGGLRGLPLYRKYIPGFDRRSRWRRIYEARRLNDAIHSREKRGRKKQSSGGLRSRDRQQETLID